MHNYVAIEKLKESLEKEFRNDIKEYESYVVDMHKIMKQYSHVIMKSHQRDEILKRGEKMISTFGFKEE